MIERQKKLGEKEDLTAQNIEDIFNEISGQVPTEDDYRIVTQTQKVVDGVVPAGLRDGEMLVDNSDASAVKLTIRIGKKMYKVDLTEL